MCYCKNDSKNNKIQSSAIKCLSEKHASSSQRYECKPYYHYYHINYRLTKTVKSICQFHDLVSLRLNLSNHILTMKMETIKFGLSNRTLSEEDGT